MMIEKLVKLWFTNKKLFYLLLIPLGLIVICKIALGFNKHSAEKALKKAVAKEKELKKEQDELNEQAKDHLGNAEKAADRIENRHNEGGGDPDWHKKM